MPTYDFAEYGVVGFVLLIVLVTIYKLPEIIKAAKTIQKPASKDGTILEGLTTAITKLTVFLETDTAVNKEKEKVLYGNIADIRLSVIKLQENDTNIIKIITEHALKCDMKCINRNGGGTV